ncbi:Hypothetical protein R9X50_00339100 [Acrodontium crateriforme]|uniref:Actin cytoskeleton-regulatory complex protein SLA1 n=1 Tax=Acrodontium crateriforme TaxID=150365 RepID=A0AAQ3R472_9PEZI|nr:Hypothetical protein R9X50_00339100 [Acrodontium crateriforme]
MAFLGVYRAIYDYQPQSSEELEITENDLLFVLEKSTDDDWWKCKKKAVDEEDDEPEGLVPSTYIEEATATHQAQALYDYTKQTDEELTFKEETILDVYDESDPDWVLVGHNGQFGFAPAIYIKAASPAQTTAAPTQQRELAPPPMPTRPLAADEPIPGEADYEPPSASVAPAANNPAAALAGIIAQRTGGAQQSPTAERAIASPPLPSRPHYEPEPEQDEAPPPMPRRPDSHIASPSPPSTQYTSPRMADPPSTVASPTYNTRETLRTYTSDPRDDVPYSPVGYHLYNIHETISHMGKNKKMPTTLGINVAKGMIMISPEKSKDGPSQDWTAEKLTHYSIEGKHVFVELVKPSKSVDFHAGAKDTAQEIVAHLGELAGAHRAGGLREVIEASAGSGADGQKLGKMLYEFMAQGDDEVSVGEGDEVVILDDFASDEWWKVKRLKTGVEGVVPASFVEITGTIPRSAPSGVGAARATVEYNRLEEARLAKEAAKKDKASNGESIPERGSSLATDSGRRGSQRTSGSGDRRKEKSKTTPNSARVRTWTDRTGTFKVEAEFIGLREGKIHLHKMNGVKIAVPVSKMAVEDLEYVERATGASLDEDKPLSDIKRRSNIKPKDNGKKSTVGASVQPENQYDWFDFFLQCGVNPQICERYAGAFSRDQMGPEVLPEVNEQLLRTLGLKEGDILRVMKHLDSKYDRKRTPSGAPLPAGGDEDTIEPVNGSAGGLFSGPGGALKNNTRKGRPAPAVQTNDTINDDAFKTHEEGSRNLADAKATPLTTAPARKPTSGFDDDAWDVKPTRSQPAATVSPTSAEAPKPIEAPKPKINEDLASLSIDTPALQPTPAPAPVPVVSVAAPAAQPAAPVQPTQQQGADQALFQKIAEMAPARQRPAPPAIAQTPGALGFPPPPRAASAPGFNSQQAGLGVAPLQAQLTGYQPPPGQSLADLQRFQQMQQMQQQQMSFMQAPQGYGGFQPNGMMPQPTGVQAMQQNYPAMQPQPTGFQPQMSPTGYGPQMGFNQAQPTGYGQPGYPQQLVNGTQTGSPFADPPRQPFQPMPSSLSNSFQPQPTGFQPSFNISQPTGMNGFGAQPTAPLPSLPPQQIGGVFGPSAPVGGLQAPPAPLVAQKTGPPPPVRFGVTPGAKALTVQPTGRANLAKATPQNPFGF